MELSAVVKEEELNLTLADGSVQALVMKEMTGEQRDIYFDKQAALIGKDGHITKFKDLHCLLITLAVFDPATGKTVTLEESRKWPASTQSAVFKRLQELSGIGAEKKDDDPKND